MIYCCKTWARYYRFSFSVPLSFWKCIFESLIVIIYNVKYDRYHVDQNVIRSSSLFKFPNNSFQNQISWIRRRDWHILSSGAQMYTNDERFVILHTPGSNTWTLQIKFVQRRDHGMYECQVMMNFVDLRYATQRWSSPIYLQV